MRPDNYADYAILQRFKETNTLLYLPEGPMDFASKSGRLMGTIRAAIAAEEREVIRERMMGGKEALRRMGRWAAGRHQLPFGVDYDRKTFKFSYKPEVERVREVYARFLAGDQNYDALSEYLGLTRGTAKNILQNPIYKGWLVYREKRDMSGQGQRFNEGKPMRDRRKMSRPKEETYQHKVIEPGLISEEDFDRVQKMIAEKQDLNIRQRTKIGEFTYNGFLWCATCGARIHTFRNQFNRFYYICSNKKEKDSSGESLCPYTGYMNRDKLEPMLDDWLSKTLTNPIMLQQIYDRHCRELESRFPKYDRERLVEHYKGLYAKRDRFIDMAGDGIISTAVCAEKLKCLDLEIRQAHEKLVEAAPTPTWTPAQLADVFAPFTAWGNLDRAAKRRVLNGLSPKFTISDYKIGLHLRLLGGVSDQVPVVPYPISGSNIDRPNGYREAAS